MDDCTVLTNERVSDGATLPAHTCWLVNSDISVTGGTLAIDKDVYLFFAQGMSMVVEVGAHIQATGTETEPVVFQGQDVGRGFWQGFEVRSAGSNSLDYVQFDGAGNGAWYGGGAGNGTLYLYDGADLTVTHSQITASAGRGILVQAADFSLSGSTIEDCEVAGSIYPNAAHGIADDNVLTGNDDDRMWLPGASSSVEAEQTWQAIGIPWHFDGRVQLLARLALAEGTVLEAGQGASIEIYDSGRLELVGTQSDPIVLRGEEATPGYWKGIEVDTKSVDNRFEYASVEDAGGGEWYGGGDTSASVYLTGNGGLALVHATLSDSGNYALLATEGASLTDFTDVAFVDNAKIAHLYSDVAGSVGADTTFDGNTESVVRVAFSNADTISHDQTWAALAVPYLVTDGVSVKAKLTIAAGAEVDFSQDASVIVETGGSLSATGTSEDRVLFAQDPASGWTSAFWKGIQFKSLTSDNALEHTTVSYSGSAQWYGGGDAAAALYVTGSLALTDVIVDHSGGYGVIVEGGGALTCSNVDFVSNEAGPTLPVDVLCE